MKGETMEGNINLLKVGDKVHYQPEHYGNDRWENGMVKEIRDYVHDSVWVVYNCANNWERFKDYTSAKTNLRDLKNGWK
jgi:hypothetical protein